MKKKIFAIILAAAFSLSLVACGGSGSSSTDEGGGQASAASSAEAEFHTIEPGKLYMGTNAQFPPYEYYEGEKIVGIDAEIMEAIAGKLGLTLEIVDMDFAAIVTSVQSGKIDVGAAGMTVTEERLENVNFTESYAVGVQVIIVPEDSEIASVKDLDDKLIGCQEATTGYIYCCEDFGEENVIPYNNGATAVQALKDGKIDCVVIDKQPAISFVEKNPGLKILDTAYTEENYAIAVSKDNPALMEAINKVLVEMINDGTVQSILDKYITAS
ncbi:MAG: amino acid ABC transporter substrate-binding protein [Eubacterium sp.]|nr:amino acid ABC transporter substrate-binding protein [Eubacterium sp.]